MEKGNRETEKGIERKKREQGNGERNRKKKKEQRKGQ